ncbi:MAG: hypothetical protein ACSHX0_09685 [Akkermansiaceae bacterium]
MNLLQLLKKLTLCALIITPLSAQVITIADQNGNTTIVSLISRQGDKALVKRMSDGKEFAISPDQLSESSKKELLTHLKKLAEQYPELEIDVVVSKRRNDRGYSAEKMVVSSKVTVTNKDYKIECPPSKLTIVFIGEDLAHNGFYKVLSKQSTDITPTHKGSEFETEAFYIEYYDDNYYSYNHGHKYVGYLAIITDNKGNVIEEKTVLSAMKKALEENANLAKNFLKYKKEDKLNQLMEKSKNAP